MSIRDRLSKAISGYKDSSLRKAGGEGSVYTLIMFEGCDLHDILHCSHFATDDISAYDDIKKACDEYFEKKPKSIELEFNDQGTLGKKGQPVLFLTKGEPCKDLFDKLSDIATYKYPSFKPHISVTSNVDSFKGKVSKLVISVDGDVKASYDFDSEEPMEKADKPKFDTASELANIAAQLKAHKERHAATMAAKPQTLAMPQAVQEVKPTLSSQLESLADPTYVNIHQHRSAMRNNIPNPVSRIQHLDDVKKLNQYHGKDIVENISPNPNPSWGYETYRVNPDKSMHLMDSQYDTSDSRTGRKRG